MWILLARGSNRFGGCVLSFPIRFSGFPVWEGTRPLINEQKRLNKGVLSRPFGFESIWGFNVNGFFLRPSGFRPCGDPTRFSSEHMLPFAACHFFHVVRSLQCLGVSPDPGGRFPLTSSLESLAKNGPTSLCRIAGLLKRYILPI